MEYTFEKRLKYAKWLLAQDRPKDELCYDLVGKWVLDEKMEDLLGEETPELEIFDLALCCSGRGCDDDRDEVFQEIVELIDKALER